MTRKKMSWECSNKQSLFFSLILLIIPTFLHSMDERSYVNLKQNDEYQLAPDIPESMRDTYSCEGRSWKEMMEAFENAPEDARLIVDHLQNPSTTNPMFRGAAFFVGRPGTGKTTTALAIPQLCIGISILSIVQQFLENTVIKQKKD